MTPEAMTIAESAKENLRRVGRREGVIQIVPPRNVVRPAQLREDDDHELVTRPLSSPTGPGGAQGFHNRNGSQIAVPEVTNVYLGTFWGDRGLVDGFGRALLEHGYFDPLKELGYGTGSGHFRGAVDGPALTAGSIFSDSDAQSLLASLLDD